MRSTHVPESVERRGEGRVAEDDAVANGPEHEAAEDDPDGALMQGWWSVMLTIDIFGLISTVDKFWPNQSCGSGMPYLDHRGGLVLGGNHPRRDQSKS